MGLILGRVCTAPSQLNTPNLRPANIEHEAPLGMTEIHADPLSSDPLINLIFHENLGCKSTSFSIGFHAKVDQLLGDLSLRSTGEGFGSGKFTTFTYLFFWVQNEELSRFFLRSRFKQNFIGILNTSAFYIFLFLIPYTNSLHICTFVK